MDVAIPRKVSSLRAFWRGFIGAGRHTDELLKLRDELKAERALNSEYNALVDELLTTLAEQRERLNRQAELITALETFQQTKVLPFVEAVRDHCVDWQRGRNHGFRMDTGDEEC